MNCKILNLMVAMRDGVKLHTTVYLPEASGKYPAELIRTPYASKTAIPAPKENYLKKDIVRVCQDCRGTGQSEGVFYPWHAEINDGEDCLKWLAAQPWCNGRIVMDGDSHPGAAQWYAAFSSHPALVGITPGVAPCNCHESPQYIGGAFCLKLSMQWGMGNHYKNGNYPNLELDWDKLAWHLPLKDIDAAVGLRKIDFWHDWMEHSDYDPYWEAVDLNKHFHRIKAPAYISGGWFDIYARGTLESFAGMKANAGSEKARKFTRCIIGPWLHGGLTATMDCGDNASQEDMQKNYVLFRENILKDPDADPLPDEPPLKYFMMGSNKWRASDTWPVKGVKNKEYFLHSSGCANSRFGDGSLDSAAPGKEDTDTYIYDPRNPVPSNGGCTLCMPAGVFDQAKLEERTDILVFSSEVLKEDIEVVGNVRLILHAASSAPDTDFTAKLVDIYPDGRALNLCDSILRARYRKSMSKQELLKKGNIYEYDIDCWDTANCFKAGHRIRIEVSSSNFPRFDRNPNTGHKLGEDNELRMAKQVIYHDADHPSRLILPVLTK